MTEVSEVSVTAGEATSPVADESAVPEVELGRLDRRAAERLLWWVIGLVLVGDVVGLLGTDVLVSGLVVGAIYGLVALGIVLVYKGSRVLNFAQPEIGTFALFVTWSLFDAGLPWALAAVVAVVGAGIVSLLFERLVVARMSESPRLTVAVATVGLMLLLIAIEAKFWGSSPRFLAPPITGSGVEVAGLIVTPTQLLAFGVAIALGLGLTVFLRRTDFGLGVLASAQNQVATRLVGVKVWKTSAFTWVVAGMIGAVAALLIEPTIGAFSFGFMTNFLFVPALAAALIGGLTSLNGAFVGGLLVGIVDQAIGKVFVTSTISGINTVVVFALIVLVLLARPQGLFARGRA